MLFTRRQSFMTGWGAGSAMPLGQHCRDDGAVQEDCQSEQLRPCGFELRPDRYRQVSGRSGSAEKFQAAGQPAAAMKVSCKSLFKK